jgi:drug/metabolite transporter (DMT)-like permease
MQNSSKSLYNALLAVLFWSTVATAFKLTLQGMNPAQLLFYSSITSTIVLFFIAFKNSRKGLGEIFARGQILRNIFFGLINPFIYYLILFKGYSLLPAQEAQPINLTWPLILSILSFFFLKQKLALKTIAGLIISFSGVVVIATRGDVLSLHFHNLLGVILCLSSSVIWAGFWILNLLDKREESIKLFGAFLFGSVFSFLYLLFFDSFGPIEIKYLGGAVYIGFFEMGITFFIWLKALSLSDNKAKTSTIVYLFPVISLSLITFVLGEKILVPSIVGLILIMGGILYQQFDELKILEQIQKLFRQQ